MSKKNNRIISLVIFLLIVVAFFVRRVQIQKNVVVENTETPKSAQLEFQVGDKQKDSYSFTATESGQNALELVQKEIELDLKEYDFGIMINGVEGLMADEQHYWAIYQNGEYASVGIADLKLEPGDQVELKYEQVQL